MPSGKLPLPLANDFNKFSIDKIDKIRRGFQDCQNSEDIIWIPDFPLKTNEQILNFIKKINKTFLSKQCIRMWKSCFCSVNAEERQWSRYFKFISALIHYFIFVQSNGVYLLTALAESFE